MVDNVGTYHLGAQRLVGKWSPVTGMHGYRNLAADYHKFRVYAATLREEVAADALANGDTYTWTFGVLTDDETLVGAYLVLPRDFVGDAADYHTWSVEVGTNAVCSRTTVYGLTAGVVWEISRSNSTNRPGEAGEDIELICTTTVGAASVALYAGTVVLVVTKVTEP